MSTMLNIAFFTISLLTMVIFLLITTRAIQRREIRRLGVSYIKQPVMFVAVCGAYALFSLIFLILSMVFAIEFIGRL